VAYVIWVPLGGDIDAHSTTSSVAAELLADRSDLIEAVTDLRWREWGHPPEPTDRTWWRTATIRESGRSELPITWVASDSSGALGAVGLGQFDIEERHDRSPWLLGMIVRPDRRGSGLGRLLLNSLESWASGHGYEQLWVANEGPAVVFYQRCGWQFCETVDRGTRPTVTVLKKRLK
jgi:GNAT superfamily N-acetyltransferase